MLSPEEAIQLLYGLLTDLGWKEGDVVNMRHGNQTMMDNSEFMSSSMQQLMERTETTALTNVQKEEKKAINQEDLRFGTEAVGMTGTNAALGDDMRVGGAGQGRSRATHVPTGMIAEITGVDVNEIEKAEDPDDSTVSTFASQLTEMRQSMVENRRFIT